MRLAHSCLVALGAIALAATPALAEDQLYQGTECESNSAVTRSSARTVNNSTYGIDVECPAVHNPPYYVHHGKLWGYDGNPYSSVRCTLYTRFPTSAVHGFTSASSGDPLVGFFVLNFGAVATAATDSVGYSCYVPPKYPSYASSSVNSYEVVEL
jgi:hypothetical protein